MRHQVECVTQSSADTPWDSSWGRKAPDLSEPWEVSDSMEARSDTWSVLLAKLLSAFSGINLGCHSVFQAKKCKGDILIICYL